MKPLAGLIAVLFAEPVLAGSNVGNPLEEIRHTVRIDAIGKNGLRVDVDRTEGE